MTIEMEQTGEPSDGLTPGVERIEWFGDGRMRWHFTVLNRNESSRGFHFDMKGSYVADERGKTYAVTGRELMNNHNQFYEKMLCPGTRFEFWLDFPAPPKETKLFKVGLLGEFTHNFGRLKPFTVKLPEPIGSKPKPARSKGVEAFERLGPGTDVDGVTVEERRPGGPAVAAEQAREPAANTPSPGRDQLARAMLAIVEKGQRFDGDLQSNEKNHDMARIIFEKSFGDIDHVQARMFSQRFSSMSFKLEGKLIEDGEAPSGLAFDLKGPGAVMYCFTLQGDDLTATDSKGKEYVFHPYR